MSSCVGIFFCTMEILNIDESHELERCEVVIKQGLQTFIEVGQALMTIKEKRLYRIGFKTFEDYCVERWAFKKSQAYQLIDASVVISNLSAIAEILPKIYLGPMGPGTWFVNHGRHFAILPCI